MNKIVSLAGCVWALAAALGAAGPKLSPQTPVVLTGVSAVLTVAGNADLLQRPRAAAVVSWDEARQAYVATLDRKFFCLSCPEQSAVVELFFFFKADKGICFDPAGQGALPLSSLHFASFSGKPAVYAYSAAAGNTSWATVSTTLLRDQPGEYYLFKLYDAVLEGGSLRFVPVAGGEAKVYIKYKRYFTAPAVSR